MNRLLEQLDEHQATADLHEYGLLAHNDAIESAMEVVDGLIDPQFDGLRVVLREALQKLKRKTPSTRRADK